MFREVLKRVVKVAWVSSPLSLQGVLEKVIDTPGGSNAYELEKLQFTWNRQQRQSALELLISKLKKLTESSDIKLQALSTLLQKAQTKSQKVIIFCEGPATVFSLYNYLKKLLPALQVTATIECNKDSQKLEMKETKEIEKLIKQFAPIANAAEE